MNILRKKVIKEYIYLKKYNHPQLDLDYVIQKAKSDKSTNISDYVAKYYLGKIKWDVLIRIIRLCSKISDKKILTRDKIEGFLYEMICDSVENFLVSKSDATYVSEFLILSITTYNNKTYLVISPRIEFSK